MARKAIPIDKLTVEHLGDFGKIISDASSPLACVLVVTALSLRTRKKTVAIFGGA